MKKFVEIIDKGECCSSLQYFVNGKLANNQEWKNHEYYPQNGNVAELVESKPGVLLHSIAINNITNAQYYILKISNEIFVPMTGKGLKDISENEYKLKLHNTFNSGMSQKQKNISDSYDSYLSKSYSIGKPNYQDQFWTDIVKNLDKHTNNFTIPIYHDGLVKECLFYAYDMCRHFERTSGLIPNDWKLHIASEVCIVFETHFKEFNSFDRENTMKKVSSVNSFEVLSDTIDNFFY